MNELKALLMGLGAVVSIVAVLITVGALMHLIPGVDHPPTTIPHFLFGCALPMGMLTLIFTSGGALLCIWTGEVILTFIKEEQP